MTRTIILAAAALFTASPLLAQTSGAAGATATTPSSTSTGNGVTTGTNSGPEMKTGAERSPTAGAPTGSAGTATGGAAGGAPNRN